MAPRGDEKIREFITKYLPILREKFRPSLVLAFGSRARGEALETSDLDLIVVSPLFENIPFLERPYRVLLELGIPGGWSSSVTRRRSSGAKAKKSASSAPPWRRGSFSKEGIYGNVAAEGSIRHKADTAVGRYAYTN
jgi:hypothetical protein